MPIVRGDRALVRALTFLAVLTGAMAGGWCAAPRDARASETTPATSYWVQRLESDLLGRTATPTELSALDGRPRLDVIQTIVTGAEYRTRRIQAMYAAYLGRPASNAEVAAMAGALGGGATLEAIEAKILTSGEYAARAGGTGGAFVARLYQDLLGRVPSSADLAAWSSKPASVVVTAVQSSTEHRARVVRQAYQALLRRSASEAEVTAVVAAWAGEQAVTAHVVASDEYATPPRIVVSRPRATPIPSRP